MDEWCNMPCRFSTQDDPLLAEKEGEHGATSERWRSRGSDGNPQPNSMLKPLVKQVARRVAMQTGLDMAETMDINGVEPTGFQGILLV